MNKSLARLMDEAQIIEPATGAIMHVKRENFEKFAELIVKKCMSLAKYHTPDTEECEHTWLIHDKIKQHFGVEE